MAHPPTDVQYPVDFFRDGIDETKFIEGTIKMIWVEHDKPIEALVVTGEHTFQVFFQLRNESLEVLRDLQPKDKILLSLRGAKLKKLRTIPKLSTLSLELLFSDGVELRWKRPDGSLRSFNTWKEPRHSEENSWYMSPREEKQGSKLLQGLKRQHDDTETADQRKEVLEDAAHREKVSQAEKKRRRSEAKEKVIAEEQLERLSTVRLSSAGDRNQRVSQFISRSSDGEASPSQTMSQKLKIGLRLGPNFYPAIKDIRMGSFTSLMGVVASISTPDLTHKGDWMSFIQIVDPSIYDENPSGLKINCFSKNYPEWLPAADFGDVVILHRVKILNFQGCPVGTGYHDKLTWAACSPPGRIHHGPPNEVPREARLAQGGYGVCFSPFYQPTKDEILHCVKLSDWWRGVQTEEQKHLVHVGPSMSYQSVANRRVHRLISEAGPSVPPDGYFDCTVEVLQGYAADSGVYSVFVTDYTCNEQTATLQCNWCPSSLSDKALRVEMWDAAAGMGPSMNPGDFFLIRNARMVTNHYSGYLQAKLQQNKMVRLKETDADTNPHLKALMERKRQWEENQSNPDNETEHRLVETFEEDKFLNCTVEILQAVTDSKEGSFIYVTDYTSHSLLESLKVDEPWAQGLTGSIVKIFLMEGQKRMTESVVPGSFYCIKKLRWKYSQIDGCIRAQLGGAERLITMVNPSKTHNEHLNGLIRRKETWEKDIRSKLSVPKSPHQILQTDETEAKERDPACIPIKKIPPPHTGPMQLKVYAKAVSFYPMNLDDVFYQFCARCKVEIPKKHLSCIKCSDFDHEYIQIKYQIYLILEDEYREQILVSINDTSYIWDGLKRVMLQEDGFTAKQLRARLSPLLGNLPSVHDYYNTGQSLPKRTSFFTFELYSWIDERKGRGYTFCKYF